MRGRVSRGLKSWQIVSTVYRGNLIGWGFCLYVSGEFRPFPASFRTAYTTIVCINSRRLLRVQVFAGHAVLSAGHACDLYDCQLSVSISAKWECVSADHKTDQSNNLFAATLNTDAVRFTHSSAYGGLSNTSGWRCKFLCFFTCYLFSYCVIVLVRLEQSLQAHALLRVRPRPTYSNVFSNNELITQLV